jgi:hypothetical protein
MSALVNGMTPPPAVASCADLLTSKGIWPVYPWVAPYGSQANSPSSSGAPSPATPANVSPTSAGVISNSDTTPGQAVLPSPSGVPTNVTPAGYYSGGGQDWGIGGRGRRAGAGAGRGAGAGGGFRVGQNPWQQKQKGPAWGRGWGQRSGNYPYRREQAALAQMIPNFRCPMVIAVPTVAPAPAPAPTPPPVSIAPSVPAPLPSPPAAPAWACPPQSSCMSGNICLDLRRGCVRSDQVSLAQQAACSAAGYAGNEDYFPCVIAPPNLPFLGAPMPNPPPYSTVAAQDVPPTGNFLGPDSGMSGLGCGCEGGSSTLLSAVGIALGIAGGLWLTGWLAKEAFTA